MRALLPSRTCRPAPATLLLVFAAVCAWLACAPAARAQESNPVDRKVQNPLTDTPNVNPLEQDQPVVRPRGQQPQQRPGPEGLQPTDEFEVRAERQDVSGPENARVYVHEGNVDARIGIYRLQADKVTVYEATNRVIAEGNVVFDQGELQRITGSRAEWNYLNKTGFFVNSTGFTNQTQDGTILYFTADRVEKVSGSRVIVINGEITACGNDEVPKWSFKAARAVIDLNDRVRLSKPKFLVKGVPVLPLPYASVSIKRRDRASGFLTPTMGGSGQKGFRISNAYYQTLGRSADITLRNDIYTQRGIGIGADLRTRANSRSFLNAGFYAVKDRIFGPGPDDQHPNQGGSSLYVDGVHYFPNGFMAAADINITSNLAFRQIFSETIQQAISPEERSQVFVNKSHDEYSLNFLARTQVTSLPNFRVRIRDLPSVSFERRPSRLKFLEKLETYFSYEAAMSGMSRKETVENLAEFVAEGNPNPIITPSMVQRLDFFPRLTVPFDVGGGWGLTASASVRGTYYSNSLDPLTRLVVPRDLVRAYGEFTFDVRPPALARNFRRGDGSFWFRHVIEPYLTYRKISGVSDFERIIRFDSADAVANTNEFEFGIVNRFFTRRSTESVTGRVSAREGDDADNGNGAARQPLTSQPFEVLSITIRQKYFFDRTFGGALIPGRRNQFYPINTFSGFTYGGVPRRFSPLYVEARLREAPKTGRELFGDVRMNLDVLGEGGGLRDLATSFGIRRRVQALRVLEAFQTYYYTRAVTLAPSLRHLSDRRGNEPGTLQGSQWSPSVFMGDRDRGLFGGASFFFDFQNRPGKGNTSLISSTVTLGYTWDCCNVTVQNSTFNVGLRKENRVVFTFRLNGIGTFGTEPIGQRF